MEFLTFDSMAAPATRGARTKQDQVRFDRPKSQAAST